MFDTDVRSLVMQNIRRRAEEKIAQVPVNEIALSAEETQQMVHELLVHQIELEMQNEELRSIHAELEVAHAHYFDLYDKAPVGYFTISEQGLIRDANLTGADLLGATRGELINQPITSYIFPDDQDIYYLHRKQLFSSGSPQVFEMRFLRAREMPFWAQVDATLARTADRSPDYRLVLSDITAHKKVEDELAKTRNLESLGMLAGGIAHDFNNLLQTILANISMAKIHTPPTSQAFPFLDQAESAYEVARNLTNQFLAFSTGGASVRTSIQPAALIRDSVGFVLIGSAIRAIFDLPPDLPNVHGDPGQIARVIGNIALNARDAMPMGGRLLVSASREELKPEEFPGSAHGTYLRISLIDEGPGIARENLPKIFDPYFSTKGPGAQKGIGLGLTVSNAIIRQHNGLIRVESEPGKGAAFHIYLPAIVTDSEMKRQDKTGDAELSPLGKKILFMDDKAGVSRLTLAFLETLGYKVDVVANGDDAIKAFTTAQQADAPYAAIILDLTIPGGMGGEETLAQIRKIDPDVKAVVSSGYSKNPVLTDFARYGFKGALPKPYRMHDLKKLLDKIL